MEYNVPLGHPDYEDAKTTETNDVLLNKTLLYPDKRIFLYTLCPKKVVNLDVLINHLTRHAKGEIQSDPDYEDPKSMETNDVLVNNTLLNNPDAIIHQCS